MKPSSARLGIVWKSEVSPMTGEASRRKRVKASPAGTEITMAMNSAMNEICRCSSVPRTMSSRRLMNTSQRFMAASVQICFSRASIRLELVTSPAIWPLGWMTGK
ncbi:hypothetical protein [Cohnella rhizosphaerae]|uniref:Uncharacterized protein n=1 Tax=Cohnella rhizosphaerae TaxID=1457232 RepID=A0A9X4QRM4_9BACL|nr:hypothetical protein [Cohnella rhizosphaerae]MDG0808394.1 hypothetical protein [Cohnella rhizosphaerae]